MTRHHVPEPMTLFASVAIVAALLLVMVAGLVVDALLQ